MGKLFRTEQGVIPGSEPQNYDASSKNRNFCYSVVEQIRLSYCIFLNFIPIHIIHCYIHSKFLIMLFCFILIYLPILFQAVFIQMAAWVSDQLSWGHEFDPHHPHHSLSSFHFSLERPPENSGKPSETLRKPPENIGKIPKKAENCGNSIVFMRPTNRKHIPLHGQYLT